MKRMSPWLLALCLYVFTGALSADPSELPWVFNAPRADGYTIDLIEVQPAPGTPLVGGSAIVFAVKVRYTLSVAQHGSIVLVFQDEQNRPATKTQVNQHVDKPSGEVSLSERVAIPTDASELRLFIPLVPQGVTHTSGEVTIRYPIRKPTASDPR
jgi:hypothetical protein